MQKNKIIFDDIGFAKLDPNRKKRTGLPEAVFCKGKKSTDIAKIMETLAKESEEPVIGTKATINDFEETKKRIPEVKFFSDAQIMLLNEKRNGFSEKNEVAVVTGGTSDIPVAEEASVTLEAFGIAVTKHYDVGVAGIERLLAKVEEIRRAKVVIVIAGMEGALASVMGGLVLAPIIAVPTSVGYGANFDGIAALLSMLNSCAPGVSVVNIDNGFGAACSAIKMLQLAEQ